MPAPRDAEGRAVGEIPIAAGGSAAWREVLEAARLAALSDARVLINGESGVGKDIVARLIHAQSPRAARPLVTVNCASVADSLLESELFGHVKGSFTDAWRDTRGLAQRADGGTLFLDEVGEMSLRMQALVLRFVETGEVQPVGAVTPVSRVNVRIVAATNRRLHEMAAGGTFREDLLYRLRVIHIEVPPLRDRREDIPALIDHALARHDRPVQMTYAAREALERHHWPGNVRELQNVIEQAVWMARGDAIDLDHLPETVRQDRVFLRPARERRRTLADRLFEEVVAGHCAFWEDVHQWFLARDLTRDDLRGLVGIGLAETRGNYHALLKLFRLPPGDYKRLLNFLAAHECRVDVRPYRQGTRDVRRPRAAMSAGDAADAPGTSRHGRVTRRAS